VTVDIPYASPPQGMKYFTIIGPHIDCMDEHYLVRFHIFIIQIFKIVYLFTMEKCILYEVGLIISLLLHPLGHLFPVAEVVQGTSKVVYIRTELLSDDVLYTITYPT
jgi:hypothetical protein